MDTDKWNKWDKGELERLYRVEKKTLQEIGDKFGVTRSRVQQVMHRMKIQRREQCGSSHKNSLGRGTRYLTLNDYLQATASNNKSRNFASRTVKKYFPESVRCGECGQVVLIGQTHIHHIVYPATSVNDIQVLCPSCHTLKHRGKMVYAKQVSVYTEYLLGKTLKELSEKYEVSTSTIKTVIKKIETNSLSLHEATLLHQDQRRKWHPLDPSSTN